MGASEAPAQILLGDPVPWFNGRTVTGAQADLHVDAGRWVVLAFAGALEGPRVASEMAALLSQSELFNENRLVVYVVLTTPPREIAMLASISGPALAFIADYDESISRSYGAAGAPRTVILDPMLRAVANIPWDHPAGHAQTLKNFLRELPDVDQSAGVPLSAPVLIVPRVFDFPLCELLVGLYGQLGGEDSGFLLDQNGRTATVIDHHLKQRRDLVIVEPGLREAMRDRIVRRLLPAVERFFQFRATRMDRYLVSCYDSTMGGHFFRHRDNINAGAQHRRFAVSLNLNSDYEGCDLIFPEFGRRTYRPPMGGAVVFSCGALHEVTPIVRGRRFVFVPFLYGEEDAALREGNNARLAEGETHYVGGQDRLFPNLATV